MLLRSFGLGERVRPLKLERNRQYTMWNADEAMPVNDNVYGSHPFYMELQPDGTAHGLVRSDTIASLRFASLRAPVWVFPRGRAHRGPPF